MGARLKLLGRKKLSNKKWKKEKKTSVAGWLVDDHIASYPSSKKAVLKNCAKSWCESSLTLAGWSMVSEGLTLGGESWEGRADDSPLSVNVPLSAVTNSFSCLASACGVTGAWCEHSVDGVLTHSTGEFRRLCGTFAAAWRESGLLTDLSVALRPGDFRVRRVSSAKGLRRMAGLCFRVRRLTASVCIRRADGLCTKCGVCPAWSSVTGRCRLSATSVARFWLGMACTANLRCGVACEYGDGRLCDCWLMYLDFSVETMLTMLLRALLLSPM